VFLEDPSGVLTEALVERVQASGKGVVRADLEDARRRRIGGTHPGKTCTQSEPHGHQKHGFQRHRIPLRDMKML
jgi:hypothetical protein